LILSSADPLTELWMTRRDIMKAIRNTISVWTTHRCLISLRKSVNIIKYSLLESYAHYTDNSEGNMNRRGLKGNCPLCDRISEEFTIVIFSRFSKDRLLITSTYQCNPCCYKNLILAESHQYMNWANSEDI
jgi:hypothetical protein